MGLLSKSAFRNELCIQIITGVIQVNSHKTISPTFRPHRNTDLGDRIPYLGALCGAWAYSLILLSCQLLPGRAHKAMAVTGEKEEMHWHQNATLECEYSTASGI